MKNLSLLNHWPFWKLSLMQKIRKILHIVPEKKAKFSILSPNLGQFGLFWPNKNFLKNLGFLNHWLLWKLSFMRKRQNFRFRAKIRDNLGYFGRTRIFWKIWVFSVIDPYGNLASYKKSGKSYVSFLRKKQNFRFWAQIWAILA